MSSAIQLKGMGVQELSHVETTEINGGLWWILVNAAVLATVVAAGAAVVASAEAGYNQACGCQ